MSMNLLNSFIQYCRSDCFRQLPIRSFGPEYCLFGDLVVTSLHLALSCSAAGSFAVFPDSGSRGPFTGSFDSPFAMHSSVECCSVFRACELSSVCCREYPSRSF